MARPETGGGQERIECACHLRGVAWPGVVVEHEAAPIRGKYEGDVERGGICEAFLHSCPSSMVMPRHTPGGSRKYQLGVGVAVGGAVADNRPSIFAFNSAYLAGPWAVSNAVRASSTSSASLCWMSRICEIRA